MELSICVAISSMRGIATDHPCTSQAMRHTRAESIESERGTKPEVLSMYRSLQYFGQR